MPEGEELIGRPFRIYRLFGRAGSLRTEAPPLLFGFNIVDDSFRGSGTRKGDKVCADRKVLDADIFPAGRKVGLEHDRFIRRVGLDAEEMLDQWQHDAVAGPCDREASHGQASFPISSRVIRG